MIELMQKKKMLLNLCLKMQIHPWSNVDIVVKKVSLKSNWA